jgi:hypothetical protein
MKKWNKDSTGIKEWYGDLIGVYENYFSKDSCDYIINDFETQGPNVDKRRDLRNSYQITDESSTIVYPPLQEFLSIGLVNCLTNYSNKYPAIKNILNIESLAIADLKMQKTTPGQGYHVFHCENETSCHPTERTNYRLLAYTIYLNDVKKGGETEFLHQSLRIKPTQGTVCIFPAYFTHIHRGNSPLKGNKYILTGWIERDYNDVYNNYYKEISEPHERSSRAGYEYKIYGIH